MARSTAPVFGDTEDVAELDDDPAKIVEFSIVGFDMVPHMDGHRDRHVRLFRAIPNIPAEKVVAAFGRSEVRGQVHAESIAKIILNMIVLEDREAFLDFIDDPNLTFTARMFEDAMTWLTEQASDLPKELPNGSADGPKANGRTPTGGRSGRSALPRGEHS